MDITPIINMLDRDGALRLDAEEKSYSENEYPSEIDTDQLFYGNEWDLSGDLIGEITGIAGTGTNDAVRNRDWPEDIMRTDSGIWDLCAWYQPIHFFAYNWGIYIREDCLINLAKNISSYVDKSAINILGSEVFSKSVLRAAFQVFYLHEHFHHKVESFGIRLHVSQGSPSKYLEYKQKVYRPNLYTDDCLEEALANADSYRRISDFTRTDPLLNQIKYGAKQYLKDTFKYDPPGYRKAQFYLGQEEFKNGLAILQCQINEGTLSIKQNHEDWFYATQMIHSLFNHRSSIYSVVKKGTRPILPSRIFPKPCSTDEMIKIYKAKGYHPIPGGKGSHVKLRNSNGETMILPGNRKELSIGVLNSALKNLGYSIKDLSNLI